MKCFDDQMALEWQSDYRILWEEANNSFFLPSLKSMSMDKKEVEGKKVGETVVTL